MFTIITGEIGIGKSTVCQRTIKELHDLGHKCEGFLNFKSCNGDIILEDIQSGEKRTLASPNVNFNGPRVRKYSFNQRIINLGLQIIANCDAASILVIDELGWMELYGGGFAPGIKKLIARKDRVCILIIRKGEVLDMFLPKLPTDLLIFEVLPENRNTLPKNISLMINREIQKKV